MATGVSKASFDSLRTLNNSGISASYAAVGVPFANQVRAFNITNNTDGDLIFSLDSSNADGNMFVAKNSYKTWDIQSNMNTRYDDKYVLPIGTQVYVKQSTAPTVGDVWLECLF